jgi:DNA/RNA-binding domain of Phe-tRNA-synthetase-like protein
MKFIELSNELQLNFKEAIFGSLIIKDIPNKKKSLPFELKKSQLEKSIQNTYNVDEDYILNFYKEYFKKWSKSYPIDFQIKSISKGKRLPNISVLVDSMFYAEMKNKILTSGHDLDQINGNLKFEVSNGHESYLKFDGKDQQLKKGDIYLRDDKNILASILYGPAKSTSITMNTKNVLFLAWCPVGITADIVKNHLMDIIFNLKLEFENLISEVSTYSSI